MPKSATLTKVQPSEPRVRLAEMIASLSLDTDLATGQPLEHDCAVGSWQCGSPRTCALGIRELSDV
jgi:hypothetical protein